MTIDFKGRVAIVTGAGSVEAAHITMTQGDWIGLGADAPERLAAQLDTVRDRSGETVPPNGSAQGSLEVGRAIAKLG